MNFRLRTCRVCVCVCLFVLVCVCQGLTVFFFSYPGSLCLEVMLVFFISYFSRLTLYLSSEPI